VTFLSDTIQTAAFELLSSSERASEEKKNTTFVKGGHMRTLRLIIGFVPSSTILASHDIHLCNISRTLQL
jgi:hypothetical protein